MVSHDSLDVNLLDLQNQGGWGAQLNGVVPSIVIIIKGHNTLSSPVVSHNSLDVNLLGLEHQGGWGAQLNGVVASVVNIQHDAHTDGASLGPDAGGGEQDGGREAKTPGGLFRGGQVPGNILFKVYYL